MALHETPVTSDQTGVTGGLLDIEVHRSDDHALVVLVGELDTATAGKLYEKLAEIAADGVRHVALNLAKLAFIDSTGLSVLVSERKRVASMGGELTLISTRPPIRRLLELTGLGDTSIFRSGS